MIHDMDEALKRLLRRDVVPDDTVELSFEAPTKDWAGRRGGTPTLNVYLYDIREAIARREVMFEPVHDDAGRTIGRRQPPRYFQLSYLLTAWTQRPEDEHRLLAACLACFLPLDVVPADLLGEALTSSGRSSYVTIAQPPPDNRKTSELWSAVGGELKPSLDLQVTAPFDADRTRAAGPPVVEAPRFEVVGPDGRSERRAARAGAAGTGPADEPAVAEEEVYGGPSARPLPDTGKGRRKRGGDADRPATPAAGRTLRARELPRR